MSVQTIEEQKPTVTLSFGSNSAQQAIGKGKTMGIDSRAEENQLLAMISKLVSFAKEAAGPGSSIPLPNTTLAVSFTEWQSLVAQYPEAEKSFRADFNRVVRRATAISAAIQEEMALYKVRLTSQHLWKQHWNSLCHLEECATRILPELEQQGNEARCRGLIKKDEDVKEMVGRMQKHLQEIPNLSPETIAAKMDGLGLDPKWEETRLQGVIGQLISLANSAPDRLDNIPLSHCQVAISSTVWQVLTTDYPENEISYRADFNRVVRVAAGILAAIEEQMALSKASGEPKFHEKNHLTILFYMAYRAGKVMPELETLKGEAQRRGLAAKAADTQDLILRMRQKIDHIANLHQRWKEQAFGGDAVSNMPKGSANVPTVN